MKGCRSSTVEAGNLHCPLARRLTDNQTVLTAAYKQMVRAVTSLPGRGRDKEAVPFSAPSLKQGREPPLLLVCSGYKVHLLKCNFEVLGFFIMRYCLHILHQSLWKVATQAQF